MAEVIHGEARAALFTLPRRARDAILGALFPGEAVQFACAGAGKQALAGTDRRVLVYKGGSNGALVSWEYATITAVQLHRSRMNTGVLILDVPGLPPVSTSYWATGSGDPAKAANAVPLDDGAAVAAAEATVAILRQRVRGQAAMTSHQDTAPPDAALRRIVQLSELRDQGVLTPDEFSVLKTWMER